MSSYQSDRIGGGSSNIAIPLQQQRRQSNAHVPESLASRRSSILLSTSHLSGKLLKRQGTLGQSSPGADKNLESRVFIDIDSPNFKTVEQKQHEEIVNSLRNYYLNDYVQSKRKLSSTSVNTTSMSNMEDEEASDDGKSSADEAGLRHDSHLNSVGGDITREFYWIGSRGDQMRRTKNRSCDDLSLAYGQRRGSTASALNVPGGFRREYIVSKIRKDASSVNEDQTAVDNLLSFDKVPFLTRNFLEFLYVEGHFAGESFDEEFALVPPTYTTGADEHTPLLLSSDPEQQQQVPAHLRVKTSTFKAFLLMIKSFIGTGVLFLPNAFSNGGLAFSISMLFFFSVYSYWCYYILVRSKDATGVSSFGDIGGMLFGTWMKFIILFSLVLTQIGFAGAYVVFTAKNLIAFLDNVFHWPDIPVKYLLLTQLVIFIPLSFVRNVSKLSITSLFANFFIISGLFIVVYYTACRWMYDLSFKPAEGVIMVFNPNRWSLFIGTAIFAFEGIGLIIPVQESMRHPEEFPKVLGLVIITTTVLFITIGTLGYLAYGDQIQSVILLNLPQDSLSVNMIQLFYSMAILLSTPLQLFPAIGIIENKFFPRFTKVDIKGQDSADFRLQQNSGRANWRVKWSKNLVRSIIVLLVIILAYFGADNLDLFVSIVGCLACIPLVYIYPPMLHLRSCSAPHHEKNNTWKTRCSVLIDYLLIIFGCVSMCYTSYQCFAG
ncbi:AaceriAER380Cp [[Ashbya] aceris (nom. inval.)]|nr:AaceriAER380Cp [[Ashbya] aceris (nom. inval.)]